MEPKVGEESWITLREARAFIRAQHERTDYGALKPTKEMLHWEKETIKYIDYARLPKFPSTAELDAECFRRLREFGFDEPECRALTHAHVVHESVLAVTVPDYRRKLKPDKVNELVALMREYESSRLEIRERQADDETDEKKKSEAKAELKKSTGGKRLKRSADSGSSAKGGAKKRARR